jgi:transposase-like protein
MELNSIGDRVNMEGKKEFVGLWITENESSKFWLSAALAFE